MAMSLSLGQADDDGDDFVCLHREEITTNGAFPQDVDPRGDYATEAAPAAAPPSRSALRRHGRTILVLLAWFAVSNAAILIMKWLFTNHFPYPLTATCVYNATAAAWAAAFTFCRCFCCCPRGREQHAPLSRRALVRYVLPVGLCTGVSIACNNVALKILSVSFGTILKGSGPIFTFGWGLALGLEKFAAPLAACLLLMALGIALASLGEGSAFDAVGFVLALTAQCVGALGWALMHRLLLDEDDDGGGGRGAGDDGGRRGRRRKMPPLKAVLYTSPTIVLFVLPLALELEGSSVATDARADSPGELLLVVGTMLFAGTLVFVLLMSEYWLLNATSSLGLSVASVVKELLAIGGGIFFFAERLDWLNVVGFAICQVGILMYVKLRHDGGHGGGDDDGAEEGGDKPYGDDEGEQLFAPESSLVRSEEMELS